MVTTDKIEEYCSSTSPTLRCSEVRAGPNSTVLACVKFKGHTTPCHFETFPGGVVKSQTTCPACGFVMSKEG